MATAGPRKRRKRPASVICGRGHTSFPLSLGVSVCDMELHLCVQPRPLLHGCGGPVYTMHTTMERGSRYTFHPDLTSDLGSMSPPCSPLPPAGKCGPRLPPSSHLRHQGNPTTCCPPTAPLQYSKIPPPHTPEEALNHRFTYQHKVPCALVCTHTCTRVSTRVHASRPNTAARWPLHSHTQSPLIAPSPVGSGFTLSGPSLAQPHASARHTPLSLRRKCRQKGSQRVTGPCSLCWVTVHPSWPGTPRAHASCPGVVEPVPLPSLEHLRAVITMVPDLWVTPLDHKGQTQHKSGPPPNTAEPGPLHPWRAGRVCVGSLLLAFAPPSSVLPVGCHPYL